MQEQILEALAKLDPENDAHWTDQGDARVDAVEALVGAKLLRQNIIDAAPEFEREKMELPSPDEEVEEEQRLEEARLHVSEVEEAQRVVKDMDKSIGLLEDQIKDLTLERDKLVLKREPHAQRSVEKTDATINQERIQAFIASQNAVRMERHAAAAEMRKALGGQSLDGRSKIDQALSAKKKSRSLSPMD